MERQRTLAKCEQALNTADGEVLLDELRSQLNPGPINPDNPTRMAYQCGLRDAYEYILTLANGELVETDDGLA